MNHHQLSRLLEVTTSFIYGLFLLVPIIVLVIEAGTSPNLQLPLIVNHYALFTLRTILLGLCVSVACCLISILAIYALNIVSVKIRRIYVKVIPLSLIFPPFVGAIAYIDIFKSQPVLHITKNIPHINFLQAIFVLSLFLYPYVFLPFYTRVQMIDPTHSKILALYKLSLLQKLRLYYIPHVKHVVFSSMLLVFVYVFADFGAVSILRINTLTTAIYEEMILRSGRGEAALVSLALMFFVAILLVYGHSLVGKVVSSTYSPNVPVGTYSTQKKSLYLGVCILTIIIAFSVLIPALKILFWLYSYVMDTSSFKQIWIGAKYSLLHVFLNTLLIGVVVTFTVASFSYFFCLIKMRSLLNRSSYVSQLAILIRALPGIVVAFSIASFKQYVPFNMLTHSALFLYAYILRFTGIAFMILEPSFRSLSKEAIRIGDTFIAGKRSYVQKIIYPFTKQSLIFSCSYIFSNVIRELNIPLLLLPLGVEVLSIRIWQTASVGLYAYSAPAIAILLLLSIPTTVLYIKDRI